MYVCVFASFRELEPAHVEALNEDVMKDVIKQKSQNPPQFRFDVIVLQCVSQCVSLICGMLCAVLGTHSHTFTTFMRILHQIRVGRRSSGRGDGGV